jgi:type II restriction enzyme
MNYYEKIKNLTKSVPIEIIDFSKDREPARTPTQASSNFITNKEQGDWAEMKSQKTMWRLNMGNQMI